MDTRTERRIAALWRQLQPPSTPSFHLSPVLLSQRQRKNADSMPVVIGGMVLDVLSTPSVSSNPRSTTPGKVDLMLGGVARNIGECMAKLGTNCYMISAVGCDVAGNLLLAQWQSAGLPTKGIQKSEQIKTATVNCMFDVDGELVAGVANLESIERFLTHEWILQSRSVLHSAPLLVLDANVTPVTLEASCQMAAEHNIPVWFEPVSVAKSKRVASIAKFGFAAYLAWWSNEWVWWHVDAIYLYPSEDQITFASPNELELIEMANVLSTGASFVPIDNDCTRSTSPEALFQNLKSAILALLDSGIKFVLVTLGPNGIFLCSRGLKTRTETLFNPSSKDTQDTLYDIISRNCPPEQYLSSPPFKGISDLSVVHYPALSASVVRVSGAGDCLVGGIIASLCSGLNVMQSVAVGVAAAKAAIEVETNVPTMYNLTTLADDASFIYSKANILS